MEALMNLGAFFAARPETPQKTGLSAPIPQRHHRTLAGFPLQSLARFRIHRRLFKILNHEHHEQTRTVAYFSFPPSCAFEP
jgi:hypothetical protein